MYPFLPAGNQVPQSDNRPSTYSTAARAAFVEDLSGNNTAHLSSFSSPTASRCPSPLPLNERVSLSSSTTSLKLSGTPAPVRSHQRRISNGTVIAVPELLTADSAVTPLPYGAEPKIYLAPAPVLFAYEIRYKRRAKLAWSDLRGYETIPARNVIDPRPTTLGLGWEPHVHPEGSMYFSYKNFFTNEYLYDDNTLKGIEATIELLTRELEKDKDIRGEVIEIGLCLHTDEEDDTLGCYYICNRETEEVFWLTEVADAFGNDSENIKIVGREHLKYAAAAGYWHHVYMFPHGRELGEDTLQGLRSDLCYLMFDKMTSKTSTAPYSADDLCRFYQCINDIREAADTIVRPQDMVVIARLSSLLASERFVRYYGEPYAQLDANRSVYVDNRTERSLWFTCLCWALLFTPQVYLEHLHICWVDERVNFVHWKVFFPELQGNWTASITQSAVILSANVGYLAIQSVDQGAKTAADRTVGQILSYMSLFFSICNIITSTIMARRHILAQSSFSVDVLTYLDERAKAWGGLERLAVIYSIPTTFFMWALLTFFMAISWLCFNGTSGATKITLGVVLAISIALIFVVLVDKDTAVRAPSMPRIRKATRFVTKPVVRAGRKVRHLFAYPPASGAASKTV